MQEEIAFQKSTSGREVTSNYGYTSTRLLHINFLTMKSDKNDNEINVLLITDLFMCYALAFVFPFQTAKVTDQALLDKSFMNMGSEKRT